MAMLADRPVATVPLPQDPPPNWQLAAKSGLRAIFGIVWAINALLAWQPGFADHFVGYLQSASHGQPLWLAPWFSAWLAIVTPHAAFFTIIVRLIETAIALGLLLGFARKTVYVVGAVLSLLIWSTAEGFGGPYAVGATDIGPALVYVLVFAALLIFNRVEGTTPYSIDYYLARRWPAWQRLAEWGPASRVPLPRLSWRAQRYAIAAIVATLAVLFASFQSATRHRRQPLPPPRRPSRPSRWPPAAPSLRRTTQRCRHCWVRDRKSP